jgi:hypothetical protein
MRVRVVLGLAAVAVVGALALDMSGRAVRSAGSNHIKSFVFAAIMPPRSTLCQYVPGLPQDAASVRLLMGAYGAPLPALDVRFLTAHGNEVARGQVAAGVSQGDVTIPLRHVAHASGASRFCLYNGGSGQLAVGGENLTSAALLARVDGRSQPGGVSLFYLRGARESWWQMLGTLARRFSFGKASFFGAWTFPLLAALLFFVWVATIRLLMRELS